jgi:hypothetical protein
MLMWPGLGIAILGMMRDLYDIYIGTSLIVQLVGNVPALDFFIISTVVISK